MKYYETDNNARLICINLCTAQRSTEASTFTHTYNNNR